MAMKKVNCTLSVVCCVSLISMAIVMFVLYAQLLGEYQQLQHQYASISSQLNQTHDSTMIAELKVELTDLITNQKAQPNQTHDNNMIAELKAELTSLKGTSSELQQQDIRFSNKFKQSNKTITDQKIELTNLNDELDKSNKKIAELETQLTSLKGTSSELQQQNIRFSNGFNQSNKVITDLKVELTNLTANHNDELDKSNKKIAELETQLTSLKGTSSELQQQNIRFSIGFNQSNKVITDQKIELTNLNDELDKSNKTIAELKADLTSHKATSSDAISQLQQQDIRFSNGLNQSNKRIDELKVQLTNLNETQELLKNSITGGQSCQEILVRGQTRNGVYTITGAGTSFEAYCKQGYMVFQRRFDGSTDFNQNFQTYVNGFGNVNGEYWLGLEKLYQFTKTGKHQLRVDLVAYDGDTAYAIYEDFSIGVGPGYQLHIGKYSGTAGDSLTYHNNMKFSTPDNDVDTHSANCAEVYKNAFWFNACYHAHLNSFDYNGASTKGMIWHHFKGYNPLKETTMMVL